MAGGVNGKSSGLAPRLRAGGGRRAAAGRAGVRDPA